MTTMRISRGLRLFGNSIALMRINARLWQSCNIRALVGDLD
jgi:hypothetical protein